LLVIQGFQPRLISYVKVFGERNAVVFAVDQWVFERDVDRGFLGEALAGGLIFPYISLINEDYLRLQEVKLKKRLILELLEKLVLDFPELSYEVRIKPEYFLYETMLSRARLFPPMISTLVNFTRREVKKKNIECSMRGYLEALKALEKEGVVYSSDGYVRISKEFADASETQRTRFTNLFKTAQRTLFTSLLTVFPKTLTLISQNVETFLRFQRSAEDNPKAVRQFEIPENYLHVPTARGLVSLANRMDIEAFAKKVLTADKDSEVKIEEIGGVLNDVYLVRVPVNGKETKIVVKNFRDWSSFKWFPLTLWTFGTRTFAVSGSSRLERESTTNQLLYAKGFSVPRLLHVSPSKRLVFMEYVEGENLSVAIKRLATSTSGGETEKDLKVIRRVGEKFAEVHSIGITIGDTKPENIVIKKTGEICLLDLEQSSRKGDKVWDVAEFLYFSGHYVPPLVGTRPAELISKAFITGYLDAGGNVETVKKAASPKYTKVFSVFTLPPVMLAITNCCRKVDTLKR
jgi:tRNA A-37 threonylcarbamoyl transferase component Bud32